MERLRRIRCYASRTVMAGAGLLVLGSPAFSQEATAPSRSHGTYVEMGGNSLMGVNYEQFVSRYVSLRAGAGIVPIEGGGVSALAMVNYVVGGKHQVEVGTGILAARDSMGGCSRVSTSLVGYRYRADNGFLFRAGVALDMGTQTGGGWAMALIPAVSLGKSF